MAQNTQNIVNVEMLGAVIEEKLGYMIKLYPLANVYQMVETAGANITIPITKYIGDAKDVGAGAEIPAVPFVQDKKTANVKKIAQRLTFTQEDINNAPFMLQEEAEKQLLKSIAHGIEKDLFAQLAGATKTSTVEGLNVESLADAVVPFGEDLEDAMYLFVNPANLAELRKDPDFIVNASHGMGIVGSAGMIFGMEVIVTNNVTAGTAYIVKQGALAIYLKKGIEVETDKDITKQLYNIVATEHYVGALVDEAKAIKVTINPAQATE